MPPLTPAARKHLCPDSRPLQKIRKPLIREIAIYAHAKTCDTCKAAIAKWQAALAASEAQKRAQAERELRELRTAYNLQRRGYVKESCSICGSRRHLTGIHEARIERIAIAERKRTERWLARQIRKDENK